MMKMAKHLLHQEQKYQRLLCKRTVRTDAA
jgi:hypothetical protein